MSKSDAAFIQGAIIVFAKCPIPGSSKTRLSGMLGSEGSAKLAKAMLSDVLISLSHDSRLSLTKKILVYAPGNKDGEVRMKNILKEIGLFCDSVPESSVEPKWTLLPMSCTDPEQSSNLQSSDLGSKLADALNRVRQLMKEDCMNKFPNQSLSGQNVTGPVVFLGMDSPELPLDEILHSIEIASSDDSKAYLNPARDGGYGMLCVPSHAPTSIFEGIRWSHPLTAVSQLKALSDHGINTVIGSLMEDIDEPDDCVNLIQRLCGSPSGKTNEGSQERDVQKSDRLSWKSALHLESNETLCMDFVGRNTDAKKQCPRTFETLLHLGLITKSDEYTPNLHQCR